MTSYVCKCFPFVSKKGCPKTRGVLMTSYVCKCFPFVSKMPGPLYGMTGRSLRQGLAVKHLLAKQQTVAPESSIIGRGCPLILPSI